MNGKLEKIFKKFGGIVLRWMGERLTGTLSVTIHVSQGGITEWSIQTTGKEE